MVEECGGVMGRFWRQVVRLSRYSVSEHHLALAVQGVSGPGILLVDRRDRLKTGIRQARFF